MTQEEKNKAAKEAASAINKEFGDGAIVELGDKVGKVVPNIATGIYGVDYKVLTIGGLPRGRIVEMYGPEASGKTTMALQAVAAAQKGGGNAAYIDVEHALDPNWMSTLGVNVEKLMVSQPDYGEQACEILRQLLDSKAFDIIVVDSVAALTPKAEIDGDFGDSHMGLQARLMSQTMRKITSLVSQSECVVIFINQVRDKIGVVYGSPETTTGGRALKFYASVRLDIRKIASIKDGEEIIGNKVRVKAAKNRLGAPFREYEVDLLFDRGFDTVGSLFDAAVDLQIIAKSGAWFSYAGERLGQGKYNSKKLFEDAKAFKKLLKEVREAELKGVEV